MAKIERLCAGIAALERGRRYFSSEELAIIYDRDMDNEEKWWRVSAIRQARAAKRARRRHGPLDSPSTPAEEQVQDHDQ
jgi:hypothetical protein